jgi:hypothetical protein
MKTYSAVVLTVVCAGLLLAGVASAQTNEVLYIVDTMAIDDGLSAIYRVDLQNGVANLVLMPNGILSFNHADVLAAEPDGSKLWFIDDMYGQRGTTDTGILGWYNVADATVHTVAVVTCAVDDFYFTAGAPLVQIDQAAIATNGTLYIANNLSDSIYTVDKNTAVATLVGRVATADGTVVNIGGADIAFAADGTFYLWINLATTTPAGLYTLQLPAVNGIVTATWIGGTQDLERRFTGLAIRANGLGDLVGSITAGAYGNTVVVVDKTTGLFTEIDPMMSGGVAFDHTWGDMSIGPFPQPPGPTNPIPTFCTYTIGYWKNHAWQGKTITILGVTVDEAYGKTILSKAKSLNMSMLFAQLIAAKLNVNNATGIAVIDGAENFLAVLDKATGDIVKYQAGKPYLNWNRAFGSATEKQLATYWSGLLDEFNNIYHCLDDASVAPNTTSSGKKK